MSRRRLRAAINVIGGDAKLRDEEGNIRMFAFLKDTVDNWVEQKRVIEQKFLGATIFEYGCVKIESLTFPKNNLSFPVIRVTRRDCIELHNDTMTSQPPGSSKTPFQIFCVGFVVVALCHIAAAVVGYGGYGADRGLALVLQIAFGQTFLML